MDGLEEDDGPPVFRQFEVEHAAVEVLTEVVRLFAEVIDGIELSHEDVIVVRSEDGPWTLAVLDYVVPLATDIAALIARGRPQLLRPSEVTSDLLDQAGLLASIREMTATPFPALEDLFARLGLPIDEPHGI